MKKSLSELLTVRLIVPAHLRPVPRKPGPPGPGENRDASSLSPREIAVARLAGQGFSNKEIARELDLSTRTVVYYLSRVFEKKGIHSRLMLVNMEFEGAMSSSVEIEYLEDEAG